MEGHEERPRRRSLDTAATKPSNTCHPSFSSTLLDAIYRSIDDDDDALPRGATGDPPRRAAGHASALNPTAVLEPRKTTAVTEKVVIGYNAPVAEYALPQHRCNRARRQQRERPSEAEQAVLSAPPLLRPILTGDPPARRRPEQSTLQAGNTQQRKGCSLRSRFRASKFYCELRKGAAPVSPGARLASFLHNLFSSDSEGKPKKVRPSTAGNSAPTGVSRGVDDSGFSSASSYSRSCHVKTPSSRGKTPPTVSRVREAAVAAGEERKRAGEVARDLIREYTERIGIDGLGAGEGDDEEEEDDGASSCASADLFELENLVGVGGGGGGGERRYLDELPVYGTTHLERNRAVARGLLV